MYTWITWIILLTFLSKTSCLKLYFRITKFNVRLNGNSDIISFYDNLSIQQCTESCSLRQTCKGILYSRRYKRCDVLQAMDYGGFEDSVASVFISRQDIVENLWLSGMCVTCGECVFNPQTWLCERKDCPKFVGSTVGTTKGNMRQVGSKVKVNCRDDLVMINGASLSVCQGNGTWSSRPECLWDCGEPKSVTNAFVESGDTYEGSVRTHRCKTDYFLSRNRTISAKNVTCLAGGRWEAGPRCVKDCINTKPAEFYNAKNVTGEENHDFAKRTYTCPDSYVILSTKNNTYGGIERHNMLLTATFRNITCNGLNRNWYDVLFKCVKDCFDRPDPDNVKSIATLYTDNSTEIHYECKGGHVVYEHGVLTDDVSRVSKCTSEGGQNETWTNSEFTCIIGCDNLPQPDNVESTIVDYTFNLTTVTYTCLPGYVIFKDTLFTNDESAMITCEEDQETWNSPDLLCLKDCTNLPSTKNAWLWKEGFGPEIKTKLYECNEGYVIYFKANHSLTSMNKSGEFECTLSAGPWIGADFMCVPDCGPIPDVPSAASFTINVYQDSVNVEYTCAEGDVINAAGTFMKERSTSFNCIEPGGSWDVDITCVAETTDPSG